MYNLLGKQVYTNHRFSYKYRVLAHLKNRNNNSNEAKI